MWNSATAYASARTGLTALNSSYNSLIGSSSASTQIPDSVELGRNDMSVSNYVRKDEDDVGENDILFNDQLKSPPANTPRNTKKSSTRSRQNQNKLSVNEIFNKVTTILGITENDEIEKCLILPASQNLLRANFLEIQRRSGEHDGLNAAIDCKEGSFSLIDKNFETSIIGRASSALVNDQSSSVTILNPNEDIHPRRFDSSKSVFDVEEASKFELYAEDDDLDQHSATRDACASSKLNSLGESHSSQSIVSVYSNPKYGSGQRDTLLKNTCEVFKVKPMTKSQQLLQDIIDRRNSLRPVNSTLLQPSSDKNDLQEMPISSQQSTQILLPPLISISMLSTQLDESETLLEIVDDEDDQIPDPSIFVREYNRNLPIGLSESEILETKNVGNLMDINIMNCHQGADGLVTNIPCDSWMALPLRMLPGNMVPFGVVIFMPFLFLTLSIITYLLIA